MPKTAYIFGASKEEQERLYAQQRLYGDAKFLQFKETDTVCEVGCGSGANLWVATKLTHGTYIGIDNLLAQIDFSRKRAKELMLDNVEFHRADAHDLPLANQSVDAAFCRLVLIHLRDPLAVIKEMYRIVRVGGCVIAIEPEVKAYHTTKSALMKCFHARVNYMYRPNQGSIDVAIQLKEMFGYVGLKHIQIIQHEVFASGKTEKEKVEQLLSNWYKMNKPVAHVLIEKGLITYDDLEQAEKEIHEVTEKDRVYQRLWIARGVKA